MKEVNKEGFKRLVPQINRIWDGEQGLSVSQWLSIPGNSIEELDYIFVRDDDWTIACKSSCVGSCRNLWPEEWVQVIIHRKNSN